MFLPYVRDYVSTFIGKSITTDMWKSHLISYFEKNGGEEQKKALKTIDWDVSSCNKLSRLHFSIDNFSIRRGFSGRV